MTVKTIDDSQICTLREHVAKACALDPARVAEIRTLAGQLLEQDLPVLPILGAGASHDCGMRLASKLGEDLYGDYMTNPDYASEPRESVKADLADVAQAIHNAAGQIAVVKAIGLDDPTLWPESDDVPEHFCLYRVLSRLAREGLFKEVVGFNYDCANEAGLKREGYQLSPKTTPGREFNDHATVVADELAFYNPPRERALVYYKSHGCAQRFRERAPTEEEQAAETIIICKDQLTHWRDDLWMRERLRDRARGHLLLLIGFAAEDGAVHAELKQVLVEVYETLPATGKPRLVTIDARPDTPVLRGLVKSGLGGQNPPAGTVAEVGVLGASTTAVALILLTEWLRLGLTGDLEAAGYMLGNDLQEQLTALVITAPVMMRWTYLLRRRSKDEYIQKINLEQAANGGYAPLTLKPSATALALQTRMQLRAALGLTGPESTDEAFTDHGFLSRRGFAYMPVALSLEELKAACRPGGLIERACVTIPTPASVERVLVTQHEGTLRGVNVDTGAELAVPA
ncbi:MAG: SIR2 family protein [Solirubrobacteraceae bacterium]